MKKRLASLITVCLVFVLGATSVSGHTPPGLAKKGGLPPGIQNKFIQQEKDTKEYQTTIKNIDVKEKRIVIEDGTAIVSLLVSNKAKIELNNKSIKFEDIRKNDEAFIKLDKDNTITELRVTREKETIYTVEGKILAKHAYDDDEYLIVVQIGNQIKVFKVEDDVDMSSVKVGKEAVIYIEDDEVVYIKMK